MQTETEENKDQIRSLLDGADTSCLRRSRQGLQCLLLAIEARYTFSLVDIACYETQFVFFTVDVGSSLLQTHRPKFHRKQQPLQRLKCSAVAAGFIER